MWKMPARLFRRKASEPSHNSAPQHEQLASGSLEEMIKTAANATDNEGERLLIDCVGSDDPIFWPEIKSLRKAPTFPVEI